MQTIDYLGFGCQARTARAEIEAALDTAGWPWSLRISRWLDVLVILEDARA